ncbi:MAG: LysR family transcriptional regulator [Gammaproteobacteria bacterium]
MVEWDQWQTLLAVFRSGTYSQAAKSLGVDATTVGRRLKLLEKHVGYPLFFRQEGRLYPTSQCESLLAHIETASEALRAAEQESATSDSGTVWRNLRLTAPPFLVRNLLAPAIATLARAHRIQIELMGIASNVSLSRREADIALRIDDRPPNFKAETEQIESERIGVLTYATYCVPDADPANLPWAGLTEDYVRTSGSQTMVELAGSDGFQYRAYHFDTLREIVATGIARTMLPRFVADNDARLACMSDTMLEQPLWMLYHRQDRDVQHLKAARSWIRGLALDKLAADN